MTKCKWCPAEILWALTDKGHRIPLDPSPSNRGNIALEFRPGATPIATVVDPSKATGPLWIAHMATCPGWKKKCRRKKTARPKPKVVQTSLNLGMTERKP